jgi:hypothetical protein
VSETPETIDGFETGATVAPNSDQEGALVERVALKALLAPYGPCDFAIARSTGAQQDTFRQLVNEARTAIAKDDEPADASGYVDAFYRIAIELGFNVARAASPKDVFENEMLPRIKAIRSAALKEGGA